MHMIKIGLFSFILLTFSAKLSAEACDNTYPDHCEENAVFTCTDSEVRVINCGLGHCQTDLDDFPTCNMPVNGVCDDFEIFLECNNGLECSSDDGVSAGLCRESCEDDGALAKECADDKTQQICTKENGDDLVWIQTNCAENAPTGKVSVGCQNDVCVYETDTSSEIDAGTETDAGSDTIPPVETDAGSDTTNTDQSDAGASKEKETEDLDSSCQSSQKASFTLLSLSFLLLAFRKRKNRNN